MFFRLHVDHYPTKPTDVVAEVFFEPDGQVVGHGDGRGGIDVSAAAGR